MGKYSHKSTEWLSHEIQTFTDQPDPTIPQQPVKFNIWKVLPRLVYFLQLVIEFIIRINQMKNRFN